jgi:hypothetical protein
METTFVHFQLHIWFVLLFTMNNKHLVIAVVCYSLLFDQVFQSNDIGYGVFPVPDIFVVSFHSGLLVYLHGTAVARQSHILG